jgi:glycosyltransferase involved in cell wall biosynthesis
MAAAADPGIRVEVNLPRRDALAAMASGLTLLYTLVPDGPMGFPMSIVEAMICGTIVVAPDRPESRFLLGDAVRTYRGPQDIVRHVREVAAGGTGVEDERRALRERSARYRDPAQLSQLHDGLRSALTGWLARS